MSIYPPESQCLTLSLDVHVVLITLFNPASSSLRPIPQPVFKGSEGREVVSPNQIWNTPPDRRRWTNSRSRDARLYRVIVLAILPIWALCPPTETRPLPWIWCWCWNLSLVRIASCTRHCSGQAPTSSLYVWRSSPHWDSVLLSSLKTKKRVQLWYSEYWRWDRQKSVIFVVNFANMLS